MKDNMLNFEDEIKQFNETTGENITKEEVFKLEKIKENKEEIEIKIASEQELEQLQFKVDKIMKDFVEFYAPKGRKLKATFWIQKENKKDTYGEKVVFGDMIEVVLNIDTGTGNIEDE